MVVIQPDKQNRTMAVESEKPSGGESSDPIARIGFTPQIRRPAHLSYRRRMNRPNSGTGIL